MYPRSDRGRSVYVGKFRTLVECRAAALDDLRRHGEGIGPVLSFAAQDTVRELILEACTAAEDAAA